MENDEELFYLTNNVSYGENEERKARKLIKLAEEGRINVNVKRMMSLTRNRTCETLMHFIDDLLLASEELGSCYEEPCRRRLSSTDSSNYPDSDESVGEPAILVHRPSTADSENPNTRHPEGRQPTPRELPGSSKSQNENKSKKHDTSQRSRNSRDSKSFNLEDVTSEQLFKDLPPDTSTESVSSDKSRRKSQKK